MEEYTLGLLGRYLQSQVPDGVHDTGGIRGVTHRFFLVIPREPWYRPRNRSRRLPVAVRRTMYARYNNRNLTVEILVWIPTEFHTRPSLRAHRSHPRMSGSSLECNPRR